MALISMNCKYVTSDHIREWKSSNPPAKFLEPVSSVRFIYELCWTITRGELPLNKTRAALDAANFLDGSVKDEVASNFADTIAHMSLELTVPGELRSRLVELAKWLVESGLVPVRFFQERCEAEFLSEVDMIKIKATDLKAKEVRVNTRLLYQQTKFNLLREESEGYAKLLTLLSQTGSDSLASQNSSAIVSSIKSLTGHFDLDPNRVFDIVLEFFELHPENDFMGLIPLFPKSHLCHILGFKFQYHQRPEAESPVPSGLYRLAATLVKGNFVDLDYIYAHLLPKDEDALEQYEQILKRRIDEANKIGKINLAATGKDLMEEEKLGDVTIELYAALDAEAEATAERSMELATNQKLGLLDGFLAVDDWYHANVLFERLSTLNPMAHEQISNGLLRAIENTISPLYNRLKPDYLSKLGPDHDRKIHVTEVKKELFQMLCWVGPYLYRNVILLQKVCKVLREYCLSASQAVSSTRSQEAEHKIARATLKDARLKVEEVLSSCLLPSLQLLPANPAICIAIWEVMSLLPYEVRYRMYGEWEKDDETLPVLLAARQTAKLDTRRILKRLAKENLKQLGRMVAKVAHANPLTVLRTILHQIEAYKDMIAPVVDAFKYLTQLEYDVLEYVVLERLTQGGREKLKDDGLNLSDWLQSLASFWGHLCKKYPSVELRGLFQYLVNQLKKGEGIELVVLQELMQQMANIEYTENVTEDQLEAMSGGETLRYQATALGITRNNKAFAKSTNRLRDALFSKEEPKLALPLLLLISQHRSNIINNADAPHIKMVSEQYDRCHGALLQYVEFLNFAVTTYAQHVPSLEDLVHKYHIEPEVAFLIYRPVLAHFKPVKISEANVNEESAAISSKDLVLDLGSHRKTTTWSDLIGVVHTILPAKAWNSLSPELYLTFWGLSLHDLTVPRKRYELEIAKQRSSLKALEESSDNSHAAITKRKKDKEKIQETLDRLSSELQKQEHHVAAVHQRLLREKDSWLTSCSDSLRINMEFLQRCFFPRCVFSMIDAVYCARFAETLHSLGTPFFNTVNHIDCLICKTLQPLISSCTEYEAGRLGKFLLETLKLAYYWKSDEAIYDRECGNMPGFALLYRDPNSPRVTFAQYIRIHWKWSSRLTKLFIHCLESSEHMEIRNALTVLTKISSVFPVTKKTGINIERRVNKIKQDEREDLKVLATGVSAGLASRKNAWMTDEEFGMGYFDLKQPAPVAKAVAPPSASSDTIAQPEAVAAQDPKASSKSAVSAPAADVKQASQQKSRKPASEPGSNGAGSKDEVTVANHSKSNADDEGQGRSQPRKVPQATASVRSTKSEVTRDDVLQNKLVKADSASNAASGPVELRRAHSSLSSPVARTPVPSSRSGTQDLPKSRGEANARSGDTKQTVDRDRADAHDGPATNHIPASSKSPSHRDDHFSDKDRQVKRAGSNEEPERSNSKRRKGDPVEKTVEAGEIRTGERWIASDRPRSAEHVGYEDRPSAEKGRERPDRDSYRNIDRPERDRPEEYAGEKISRDRLVPRDRSVDRTSDRAADWNFDRLNRDDRSKDERGRLRHSDLVADQAHIDDRFSQGLPPPPPLPPNLVPHSISAASSRREEEAERRRAMQRLSPHRDEKRRVDEGNSVLIDETKRRRDEDARDRKRDDRELLALKAAEKERERDREREKMVAIKEDVEGLSSKRRKLKRDHLQGAEVFLPPPPPPPPAAAVQQQQYADRERKVVLPQARNVYMEQLHKDVPSKLARREHEQMYEREWEEDKRQQRPELKRRHHRK